MADPSVSPPSHARRMPRHTKILLGLIVGLAGGLLSTPSRAESPGSSGRCATSPIPVGQLFLRLIFMIVVPLVFSSLVLGVLELGGVHKLGRVGLITF